MILGEGEDEEMAMRRMRELYVRAVGWEKRGDSLLIGGTSNELVSIVYISPLLLELPSFFIFPRSFPLSHETLVAMTLA